MPRCRIGYTLTVIKETGAATGPMGPLDEGGGSRDRLLLPCLVVASEDRQPESPDQTLAQGGRDRPVLGRVVRGQGDRAGPEAPRIRPAAKGHLRGHDQDGGGL